MTQGFPELGIRRVPRDGALPPSFDQEGRLALEAVSTNSKAQTAAQYQLVRGFRLDGVPDVGLLERALNEVVKRHEALRTGFVRVTVRDPVGPEARRGAPFHHSFRQLIREAVGIPLMEETVEHLDPAERHQAAIQLARSALNQPLDYSSPPLMRALLVRLGPADHRLFVAVHHLVCDGWSIQIIKRELLLVYGRLVDRGRSLPEPRLQFADYAHWQRRWLESDAARPATQYWVKHWIEFGSALLTLTDLPFHIPAGDAPAVSATTIEGQDLSPALLSALKQQARERALTPYTMALAAFLVVLHAYTGKAQIAVIVPFANRTRCEIEKVVGWFANSHLVGITCEPRQTLSQVLDVVRRTLLAAFAHQEVPLGFIWKHLMRTGAFVKQPGARPRSDVWVSFDYAQPQGVDGGGLRLQPITFVAPTTMIALRLIVTEAPGQLKVSCAYSCGSFQPHGVRALLADIVRVLESMVSTPTISLTALIDHLAVSAGADNGDPLLNVVNKRAGY